MDERKGKVWLKEKRYDEEEEEEEQGSIQRIPLRRAGAKGRRGTGGEEGNVRRCCRGLRFTLKPVSHYSCESVYLLSRVKAPRSPHM